jgi:hypothetical protein
VLFQLCRIRSRYGFIASSTRAAALAPLLVATPACAGDPPLWLTPSVSAGDALPQAPTSPGDLPAGSADAFPIGCRSDADCGYDPASDRCGSDPRLNKQPPIVDQGIICYCESARAACELFRVLPVACEGDRSCAVTLDPRPHPVRATRERPHERARPCRDLPFTTTCERTNICTLHRVRCTSAERPKEPR